MPSFCCCQAILNEKFAYNEEPKAETFFVPYMWSVVLQYTPEIRWDLDRVRLFSPEEAVRWLWEQLVLLMQWFLLSLLFSEISGVDEGGGTAASKTA